MPSVTWGDLGLLALGVAVVVAVVVLYPRGDLGGGRLDLEEDAARRRAAQVRAELERTIDELDGNPDADPRALIIALYQRLLLRLRPRHGSMEDQTPREIGTALVDLYPVRREDSRELTALFEEARYSTHPLGRAEAQRARAVLGRVLDALAAWEHERDARLLGATNTTTVG